MTTSPRRRSRPVRGRTTPVRVGMIVVSEYESDPRVRRQAEALAARGDQVTVLALHAPGRPAVETVDGVQVVHLPTRKYRGDSAGAYLRLYGGFTARAAAWLLRRARSFDVVQAHSMPEALVFAAAGQRLCRVPVLLDVHDITSKLFASKFASRPALLGAIRASETASLRFATEVLTVHEHYANLLRSRTRRPVTAVMNCPDERLFAPRPWSGWTPDGPVVFSYHGLIAPRHGLLEAVAAVQRLRADGVDARLQVRGGGDGLTQLRERTATLGLTGVVDLPQRTYPITEMAAELSRVQIGLVPSQLDPWTAEVLPTKLMEYAALGIPVITFRNPVIEQYFPADSVRYVDPAGAEQLYQAMRAMVGDPAGVRAQADRASSVMAELTWHRQKDTYLSVIDRLAGVVPVTVPAPRRAPAPLSGSAADGVSDVRS